MKMMVILNVGENTEALEAMRVRRVRARVTVIVINLIEANQG